MRALFVGLQSYLCMLVASSLQIKGGKMEEQMRDKCEWKDNISLIPLHISVSILHMRRGYSEQRRPYCQ